MKKPKAIMNWSGGKDSALALHAVLQVGDHEVVGLLTTVNGTYGRNIMHGVQEALLDEQAAAIGLPLHKIYVPEQVDMALYDTIMRQHLQVLVADFASLPAGVDPCGENGEFHSFVYDGPLFSQPISPEKGEIVRRTLGNENDLYDTAFWFADFLPTSKEVTE
jgi:diphthamide synthase (EF-2-diphthine--ammonia ligase)